MLFGVFQARFGCQRKVPWVERPGSVCNSSLRAVKENSLCWVVVISKLLISRLEAQVLLRSVNMFVTVGLE